MNNPPEGISTESKDPQNLLLLLEEAHDKLGYLSPEVMAELAGSLGVSVSEVYGVATFYSFLSTQPLGRHVIRVCQSLPCFLKNSEIIIKSVEQEIGIGPGDTTPDGKFSFQLTNCIGACDRAPAMMINNEVHVDLTPQRIARILKAYE